MAGYVGADTEQLRSQAGACMRGSGHLRDLIGTTSAKIASVEWTGPDADDFRERWQSEVRALLAESADALRAQADDLTAQADDQDSTSEAEGGSWFSDLIDRVTGGRGIGGPLLPLPVPQPGIPLDPSLLDRFQDLWNIGTGDAVTDGQFFYGDGGNGGAGNMFGESRPIGTQLHQREVLWDGRELEIDSGYVDAYGGFHSDAGFNITTDQYGNVTSTAGARGGGEVGLNEHLDLPAGMSLDASARVGFEAYAEAGSTVGPDGFSSAARAGSGVYASESATLNGPGESSVGASVDGFVGARANAYAYSHATRNEDGNVNGMTFGAGADAFIGGELSTTIEGTSPGGWFSGSTSVGVQGGAGAGASGGGTISTDEVNVNVGGELAAELGLSGGTSVSVHPNAIVNSFTPGDYDIDDAVGDARGAFEGFSDGAGTAVSAINPFD